MKDHEGGNREPAIVHDNAVHANPPRHHNLEEGGEGGFLRGYPSVKPPAPGPARNYPAPPHRLR